MNAHLRVKSCKNHRHWSTDMWKKLYGQMSHPSSYPGEVAKCMCGLKEENTTGLTAWLLQWGDPVALLCCSARHCASTGLGPFVLNILPAHMDSCTHQGYIFLIILLSSPLGVRLVWTMCSWIPWNWRVHRRLHRALCNLRNLLHLDPNRPSRTHGYRMYSTSVRGKGHCKSLHSCWWFLFWWESSLPVWQRLHP